MAIADRGPFAELVAHYRRELEMAPAPIQWILTLAAPFGRAVGLRPRFPVEAWAELVGPKPERKIGPCEAQRSWRE